MVHGAQRVLLVSPSRGQLGLMDFYATAFRALGCEVRFFQIMDPPAGVLKWHCVVRSKTLQSLLLRSSYERLFREIQSFHPDLLISGKGDLIPPEIVEKVRQISGAPFLLIETDSPFVHAVRASQFWRSLPYYDGVGVFARQFIPILYLRGARRVEHLPFGYDPAVHRPVTLTGSDREVFSSNIAYIANCSLGSAELEPWLEALRPYGLKIYGLNWNRFRRGSPLHACWVPGRGMAEEMALACAGAKITVYFVRAEHSCAVSMKVFEFSACGAMCLSNRTDEQEAFFPEGVSGTYFESRQEMIEKVEYFLAHDEERERMRRSALEAVRPHTYMARAEQLLRFAKTCSLQDTSRERGSAFAGASRK